MKVVVVAGARPNFMKVAPILRALLAAGHEGVLVHTGQQYDVTVSDCFFRGLSIPEPDYHFGKKLGPSDRPLEGGGYAQHFVRHPLQAGRTTRTNRAADQLDGAVSLSVEGILASFRAVEAQGAYPSGQGSPWGGMGRRECEQCGRLLQSEQMSGR